MNSMTSADFWRRARRRGPWSITDDQGIRNAKEECPLKAVANCWAPRRAAIHIGIPIVVALNIANAADDPACRYRPLLLRCLGLGSYVQEITP